jgi:hypothetical protein
MQRVVTHALLVVERNIHIVSRLGGLLLGAVQSVAS